MFRTPLNKTWNVLDRTKAVSFALHQGFSQSIDPRGIPGVPPPWLAGDYSGAVYIQRLTTTEVMGTVFGGSKRWFRMDGGYFQMGDGL